MVPKKLKIVFCMCVLLVSGCTKRYWYRTKIDLPSSKKYSVKINIVNESPDFLNNDFEDVMRIAAVRQLKKRGYIEAQIDSPMFLFTLALKVGNFKTATEIERDRHINIDPEKGVAGKYRSYQPPPIERYSSSGQQVPAVMVFCELQNYKQGWIQWVNANDIYYLGDSRDISRTKGLVKYLIRNAKKKEL